MLHVVSVYSVLFILVKVPLWVHYRKYCRGAWSRGQYSTSVSTALTGLLYGISSTIFSRGINSTLCALWKIKHTSVLSFCMASCNKLSYNVQSIWVTICRDTVHWVSVFVWFVCVLLSVSQFQQQREKHRGSIDALKDWVSIQELLHLYDGSLYPVIPHLTHTHAWN